MKTKSLTLITAIVFVTAAFAQAATNDLSSALQRGLFEEEANHNLDAAIAAYQTVATQFDKDRKLAATAIFRLGEVYRKQGKTNEANAQYERILRDFSDQPELVKLSRGFGAVNNSSNSGANKIQELERLRAAAQSEYEERETMLASLKKLSRDQLKKSLPTIYPSAQLDNLLNKLASAEQELTALKQDFTKEHAEVKKAQSIADLVKKQLDEKIDGVLTGLETQAAIAKTRTEELQKQLANTRNAQPEKSKSAGSFEDQEIQRIQAMIKDSPDLINAQTTSLTEDVGAPLHKAAAEGQLAVASFLLTNGADIERKSRVGFTPLYLAAKSGRKAMVELLLERGANPSAEGYSGTPLHVAAQNGFRAVMEVLIAHKAPIDAMNFYGQTPLHLAAEWKQSAAAELLVAKGANVNAQDKSGANALLTAVWVGSVEITKLLLEHGGDPNVVVERTLSASETTKIFFPNWGSADAPKGLTALSLAIKKERIKIVELLLQNGVSPNAKKDQMPPLYVALNHGKQFVELLLQYKADPNAGIGGTPMLNVAAQSDTPETVEPLIAHGANVNSKADDSGETALLAAMRKGNLKTMELLLKKGADPNIPYKNGETLLGVVKRNYSSPRREVLIDLLTKYGVDQNLERRAQIAVTRTGTQHYPIFNKGINSWNRFSLLEAFGVAFSSHQASTGQTFAPWFPFPNLAKVKIHRLEAKGEREISVDLEAILKSGDCAKDIWLEWGDVIEIPEADHKVNEQWDGFSKESMEILIKCLARNISISIKDETKTVTLAPKLRMVASLFGPEGLNFWLNDVVSNSGLLRTSSDKTRVKVKRVNPATKQTQEMIFNLEKPDPQNNLWLRDGDSIEIPERDPNAPASTIRSDGLQISFPAVPPPPN